MDQKTTDTNNQPHSEDEDLRTVVGELNLNVAYLSRMVMQLQRSLNAKNGHTDNTVEKAPQSTLH